VAVLAALVDEELTPVSRHPDAQDLKHSCWEHRRTALEWLSPETRFEDITEDELLRGKASFQRKLREVIWLRRRVREVRSRVRPTPTPARDHEQAASRTPPPLPAAGRQPRPAGFA
jgi:hypothetical protein